MTYKSGEMNKPRVFTYTCRRFQLSQTNELVFVVPFNFDEIFFCGYSPNITDKSETFVLEIEQPALNIPMSRQRDQIIGSEGA